MTRYKFDHVASDGRVMSTSHYECESDESAIAHAMKSAGGYGSTEIWRGDDKVGHVEGSFYGLQQDTRGLNLPDCDPKETGTSKA